ncbi:MAG: hypothetical protein CL928_10195 [Deltaproteobacteria bacterium]|nr:hypothetical protein [Deltaproteobacteria bacterium]
MGRPIANETFVQALLTYGTYDHYDFFCVDQHHLRAFQERLEVLVPDSGGRSRVTGHLHVGLADALRANVYDVFHFGDFTALLPYMAQARRHFANQPFPISGVTHSLDGLLMSTRYQQIVQAELAPYDAVVCTSECAKESVKRGLSWAHQSLRGAFPASPVRLERIPLAIDVDSFQQVDRATARALFELPDDVIVALCVGRLSLRQKADWAPVLERLTRMRAQGGVDRLAVVIAGGGEGEEIALLEQLIQVTGVGDWVISIPNFDASIKPHLYAAADFYFSLVDNFQETFGLTLLEAMASGLPVICSEFNGYRELVDHNETGFLVPTTWAETVPDYLRHIQGVLLDSPTRLYHGQMLAVDLDAVDLAFRTLVNDRDLRRDMGERARASAQRYTWPRVIAEYETLWAELGELARSSPQPTQTDSSIVFDPSEAYAHYAARLLREDTVLGSTDTGESARQNPAVLVRYEDVQACLNGKLEQWILSTVSAGTQTVGSLREGASTTAAASPGQVDFHILWLLKHGALRIES